uniref:MSP domain-containing protein n=1 Tax=Ascaris lumbricoides TaxID=6252 RepID=A0A0M3IP69_ASCLU
MRIKNKFDLKIINVPPKTHFYTTYFTVVCKFNFFS